MTMSCVLLELLTEGHVLDLGIELRRVGVSPSGQCLGGKPTLYECEDELLPSTSDLAVLASWLR
jgi:hypothetical protein